MSKALLNEAERYLLQNWAEARELEKTMERVRDKYKATFERVTEAIMEAHPELDVFRCCLTQAWTDGMLGLGRKSWPGDKYGSPAGLWLNGLRLEELAGVDTDQPSASIWCPSKLSFDYDKARDAIKEAARTVLSKDELKGTTWTESGEDELLWLPAPSKQQLLELLLEGDGEPFVKLFVAQFDMMSKLIPVLDRVFRECMKKA